MWTYVKILIDDLSISFKFDCIPILFEQLGLTPAEGVPMRTRHYSDGLYFNGVLVAWNTDILGTVTDTFLDISGKGCRYIEQINDRKFDWFSFLHNFDTQIRNSDSHISRIDVALDLENEEVPYEKFQKYTMNQLYVCRSKVLPDVRLMRTENIYFGSPRSDRLLRIYNKALEQGLPDTYWIRLEFQLRDDCATSWYLNWCAHHHMEIGALYKGVMIDFLRFVVPPKGVSIEEIKKNRHQNRLETAPWWDKLMDGAERIPQLYLPGKEYTLERLEKFLEKQTYSSLRTYAIAHDGDLSELIEGVSHAKLNTKQKQILQQLELIRSELRTTNTEHSNSTADCLN